ncbi:hypothetical protein V1282_003385 [Nitrobacteraceae bacterium AZCC 2146]
MEPLSLHCLNISSLSPAAIYFLNVDYRQYPPVHPTGQLAWDRFELLSFKSENNFSSSDPLAHGIGDAYQSMVRRICGLPPTRSMLAIASATKATQGSVDFNTAIVAAGSGPHQLVDE